MFSNDKNIETIAQLVEALKDYIELEKDYLKLDVVDKAVRLLTAASLFVVSFLFALAIMLYASFAAVYWMAPFMGTAKAFANEAVNSAFVFFKASIVISLRP